MLVLIFLHKIQPVQTNGLFGQLAYIFATQVIRTRTKSNKENRIITWPTDFLCPYLSIAFANKGKDGLALGYFSMKLIL